jgi:copper(I)-binding protein
VPISLPPRAKSIAAVGAALLLPLSVSAACSASFGAQTLQPYQSAEGVNADTGSLAVRNVLVLADAEGKGTLHAVVVNRGTSDDRLVSVTADPSAAGVTVSGSQELPLPAGAAVSIGTSGKAVAVNGAKPGQMVKLILTFADAGPVTRDVPVLADDHYSPTPAG